VVTIRLVSLHPLEAQAMSTTCILTLSHLAVRTLEERNRIGLEKEKRSDGKWDVLMNKDIADALMDQADNEGLTASDWIVRHMRDGV
jgi:hypothetical protein